jgi:hypothetical protein
MPQGQFYSIESGVGYEVLAEYNPKATEIGGPDLIKNLSSERQQ